MNAESKTFEISSRVFKVLKEVCEVSAFAVSRFKDSRAEHTQVLHINVCIFMYVCMRIFQYFFGLLLQLISRVYFYTIVCCILKVLCFVSWRR